MERAPSPAEPTCLIAEAQTAVQPEPGFRWATRPPGWLFNSWFIVTSLVVLASAATPEGLLLLALAASGFFFLLSVVWLARLGVYAASRPLFRQPRSLLAFVVGPLMVVGSFFAAEAQLPLRVGFQLSRSQFEAETRALADSTRLPSIDDVDTDGDLVTPPSVQLDDRVGLYGVTEVEHYEEGSVFYRDFCSGIWCLLSGFAGFAHFPDEDPPPWLNQHGSGEIVDLGDGWYAWTWGWD